MSKTIGIDARLWNETGVGRYIRNLVLELEKKDKENFYKIFVLKKDFSDIKAKIINPKFKIVIADIYWHSFKEQFIFPWILYKENLDLVHFTYFSIPIFYLKNFIITIHDMITWEYSTGRASTLPNFIYWLKQFIYRLVIFTASLRAKFIIVPSNSVKNDVEKLLKIKNKKIKVIYEGFDRLISTDDLNSNKGKYFLYVGNAYPHKNIKFLINAFSEFNKGNIYKLILVGKNNYFYEKLKNYVLNKKINNIEFLGYIDDKKLSKLYKESQAVIIPSLSEGFGLPLLEALNLKVSVLASDIKVFNEIAGDIPFYFNPKEKESLIKVLNNFIHIDSKDLAIRAKRGFELSKKYSWETMAQETLGIYIHVI